MGRLKDDCIDFAGMIPIVALLPLFPGLMCSGLWEKQCLMESMLTFITSLILFSIPSPKCILYSVLKPVGYGYISKVEGFLQGLMNTS